jgi:hypothetical protein
MRRSQRGTSQGVKEDPPCGPTSWLQGGAQLAPPGSFSSFFDLYVIVLT